MIATILIIAVIAAWAIYCIVSMIKKKRYAKKNGIPVSCSCCSSYKNGCCNNSSKDACNESKN